MDYLSAYHILTMAHRGDGKNGLARGLALLADAHPSVDTDSLIEVCNGTVRFGMSAERAVEPLDAEQVRQLSVWGWVCENGSLKHRVRVQEKMSDNRMFLGRVDAPPSMRW